MAINQAAAKRIADAKTSSAGNRIKEGNYVLVVKRIFCGPKYKGTYFIPEFDVVASEKTGDVEPNRPGTDCSCAWQLDASGNSGEAARGNIKQFVAALKNISVDDGDAVMAAAGENAGERESDPDCLRARGTLIECETVRKRITTGPNAGTEGCFPRFKYVEQTSDEVAERRKKLDADKR